MRIFNKFVESKKAPQNYQDIWFDGSVVRLYKQGSWEEVSLPIEDLKMLQSFVSTAEVFQIVTELPEEGLADYIYVLLNVATQNPSIKLYTFVDSAWEEIGGMASSSLLKLSDCLIPFIPKKQSIITTEDFKEIVEKYDLINKKGISLACLYKTNNKNYSFGILTFSENNEYQRIDILSNHSFNDFKTDEKLYNPFNSYENTAWLYNTQYNILTPLGTYTSPEYSPIKDESVTKAKLSKEVQEMLENPTDGPSGGYVTPDWNALEGEPGYIENRTHYDKTMKITAPGTYKFSSTPLKVRHYNVVGTTASFVDYELNIGDTVELWYGPPVSMSYTEDGLIVADASSGLWLTDYPLVITDVLQLDKKYIPDTVLKTTPQSLSDEDKSQVKENLGITDAVTPDWNAQEGEVGYIKGRSHQISGAHGIPFEQWDKRFDEDGNAIYFHTLPTDNYSGCLIREGAWTNQEENYVFFGTEWKSLTPAVTADIRINYDSDSGDSVLEIKLYRESDSESFLATFINNALFAYGQGEIFIYKIANEFLPNTVLKTTPQTLSATDKNQALTNLGIDPVVWKYMCNPYVIDAGDSGTIPQELVSIIFDDNGHLRPIVQKLIVFVNGPIYIWDENELYDPNGGSIDIDTNGNWRPI